MSETLIDLNTVERPPVLCAILIMVYNRLADQDPELARQMVDDLPGFRLSRLAPARADYMGRVE